MSTYSNPKLLSSWEKRGREAYRAATQSLRLMPDFLIIGGNRCGTAALYEYLCGHPCFRPSYQREVHFFERHFNKGVSWYRMHFPSSIARHYSRIVRGSNFITGEATTYYIFHPHAPRRIRQTVPHAKLIALLRNPVDRAYAQYHQKIRRGYESLSFVDAIKAEPERLHDEREKMLADESYNSFNYRHFSYLTRGIYVDQLLHWMELFPRSQMLILLSEDLRMNPSGVLKQVLQFLELPAWTPKAENNYGQAEYPRMDPKVRSELIEFFKPHNRRLYEFLGRDFEWDSLPKGRELQDDLRRVMVGGD
jgi:hypothetical protein